MPFDKTPEEFLSEEINKLRHIVTNPKETMTVQIFINAMIRGGLAEIAEANGGKIIRFCAKDDDGDHVPIQEYYIPNLGKHMNLRGMMLSADDGSQTIVVSNSSTNASPQAPPIDMELLTFFHGLYQTVVSILDNQHDVVVDIQS